jgi:putative transposase
MGLAKRRCRSGQGAFWGDKVGKNPTDRGKPGTKKSILVDADGGPLATFVEAANVHDCMILQDTLEAIVTDPPNPVTELTQHLCLDKGYDNPTGEGAALVFSYVPHIRRIGEEKLDEKGRKRHPARRWVVERTLSWLSKCRAILVRYNKKSCNYLGLIKLACSLLWFRRLHGLQPF